MAELDDAVVVVTGGGTGLGKGIGIEAARRGAHVVIASPSPADEAVSQISAFGRQAVWIRTDVSSYDEMQQLAAEVDGRFGAVNVVVNNAVHAAGFGRLQDSEPEAVKRVFEVNILGVFNGIRAFFPYLKAAADRGDVAHFLNIGSEHSFGIPPFVPALSPYTVSKYTTLAFTDAARRDFVGTGVGVSVLATSYVMTEQLAAMLDQIPQKQREHIEATYETPEEIACSALDGIAQGKHIIATNPASADFVRQFSTERMEAFQGLAKRERAVKS